MIPAKTALKHFQVADWPDKSAITAFIADLEPLTPSDIGKMLAMLVDRALAQDEPRHVRRRFAFFSIARRALDPSLFLTYVKALEGADTQTRQALVDLIPKVNNVREHGKLCEMLGSPSSGARKAAADVLKVVGGKQAFDMLLSIIAAPAFGGRIEALDAMVPKVGYRALPLITAVVDHGSAEEQLHALTILEQPEFAQKERDACLAVVTRALAARDLNVVTRALATFAAIATEDEFFDATHKMLESPRPEVVSGVIEALARFGTPRALDVLRRKLREGPGSVRQTVIRTLGQIGSEEVVPLLVEALSSKQLPVRTVAAETLAELSQKGEVDVARAIIWLLRSRDTNVRRMAAEIANRVKDPTGELGPRMLRYLTDEDWWVRERVMDALAKMWQEGLTRHIVSYLQDESDVVRRFAVGALRRIKDPASLGALVRTAMGDPDWWVRETAVEVIAELGDPRAVPYLLDMLAKQPDLRVALVTALRQMKAKEAVEPIAELLTDEDPDVRLAALRALDAFGDRSQGLWVKGCEHDSAHRVRHAARALLAKWSVAHGSDSATAVDDSPLEKLLARVIEAGGEDLIIAANRPPAIKKLGQVVHLDDVKLSPAEVDTLLLSQLTPLQREQLEQGKDIDFSYEAKLAQTRFRANLFHQLSGLSAVFRAIKNEIADITKLGLPRVVSTFSKLKNGLVLVGGPTGSGKSTTLAALVHQINQHDARHILTIEDPIEMVHLRRKCLINQREVGTHTRSFKHALRSSLREDPDVILIGEMRDLDTISFAVTAAETGHLVFGTVHTVSADKSIDRVINAFPAKQQLQVRSMLSETLRGVVCQHLLRRKDGQGRVLAVEVMLGNEAVASLIRKGKTFQLASLITTHGDQGMQSMDSQLAKLVVDDVVSLEEAYTRAVDKSAFQALAGVEVDDAISAAGAELPKTIPPGVDELSPGPPASIPRSGHPQASPIPVSSGPPSGARRLNLPAGHPSQPDQQGYRRMSFHQQRQASEPASGSNPPPRDGVPSTRYRRSSKD